MCTSRRRGQVHARAKGRSMTKMVGFSWQAAPHWSSLVLASLLASCGGGGGGDSGGVGSAIAAATPASAVVEVGQTTGSAPLEQKATNADPLVVLDQAGQDLLQQDKSTAPVVDNSLAVPTVHALSANEPLTLATLPPNQRELLSAIRATANCRAAFFLPADLLAAAPVPLGHPLTMDAADVQSGALQLLQGPFLSQGDFRAGTPDELGRLLRNKAKFLGAGEVAWTTSTDASVRATHGSLARDAAFVHLLQPDAALLARIKAYLLTQAAEPLNDFGSQICIRAADGSIKDAAFGEASWLARYIVTYDAVRQGLSAADRLAIENFVRRNAYFLAAQQDYGFNYIFPQRASGNYAVRGASAAATLEQERWLYKRFDTNDDCAVDAKDASSSFAAHAYVQADGTLGPRLSVLSQWYNNRKAISALAMGAAGLLLGDSELQLRAKRYVLEWLTYSVYADGSEGEYARNGDYCVANQGLVYAHSNLQAAALLADMLARKGDNSLVGFTTRDGLFGTESSTGQPAKSIEGVIATHLQLATGRRAWYQHRGDQVQQLVTSARHLGRMDANIYKAARATDGYHHLGLLLVAKRFPNQPIQGVVLRDPTATSLAWPGSTGNAVATGFGSWVGAWTDVMNVYPSALLLRAR